MVKFFFLMYVCNPPPPPPPPTYGSSGSKTQSSRRQQQYVVSHTKMIIVQSDGYGKKGPMWSEDECGICFYIFFAVSVCCINKTVFLHIFSIFNKSITLLIIMTVSIFKWNVSIFKNTSGKWIFSSAKVLHIIHMKHLFFVVVIVRQCCRTTPSQS